MERLGTGGKVQVELDGYGRSTHDISEVFRSTMASGTLVPFMNIVGLPGDKFDIDLELDVKTHPTIGPLFGRYKVQLDVFEVPLRLYHGMMKMNTLNVGNDISKIKLPQITLEANRLDVNKPITGQQVNPSCLMAYLGIRGLGDSASKKVVKRNFNALSFIGYWDIYLNYYSNKQEGIGALINGGIGNITIIPLLMQVEEIYSMNESLVTVPISQDPAQTISQVYLSNSTKVVMNFNESTEEFDPSRIMIYWD